MAELLNPEDPADVMQNLCMFCVPPHALYPHEIAAEIMNGIFIDYATRRKPSQVSFVMCKEHRDIFVNNTSADLEEAVIRRAAMEEDPALDFLVRPQYPARKRTDTLIPLNIPGANLEYPRTYRSSCRECGESIEVTVTMENGERKWRSDHTCERNK